MTFAIASVKVRFQVLEENFGGLGKPTFCGLLALLAFKDVAVSGRAKPPSRGGEQTVDVDMLVAGARMAPWPMPMLALCLGPASVALGFCRSGQVRSEGKGFEMF